MVRKFNDEDYLKEFVRVLEEEYYNRRGGFTVLSITRTGLQAARNCKFALSKNRENMKRIIKGWWDNLPKYADVTDDKRPGKVLFGHWVWLSSSWGPVYLSLGRQSGVDSMGLITVHTTRVELEDA